MEVFDNINALLTIVEDAKKIPFSENIIINKNQIIDIINRIKKSLPDELEEAQRVINEKYDIIVEAKREAEVIVKDAEIFANQQVINHEITKQAEKLSEQIIQKARINAREVRLGAKEYSKDVLTDVQKELEVNGDELLNFLEKNFSNFLKALEKEYKLKIDDIKQNLYKLENYK